MDKLKREKGRMGVEVVLDGYVGERERVGVCVCVHVYVQVRGVRVSVQFKMVYKICAQKSPHAFHPVSQTFLQCCL